ncbi:MAG TPA: YifB family Mg chelatase-like AAA ATPase [Burkholderiales bacterium]
MSLAVLRSRALSGMDAPEVTVEVHLANGLPSFTIVGLPDTEVKESRDRVRAALVNSRFEFPARRITVNLAPAELPKESGRFDLPIALGILAASQQLAADNLSDYEFAGELSLTGELRPVRGALAMTWRAARAGRAFVLPPKSAGEAALVTGAQVYAAGSLLDVCAHLSRQKSLERPAEQATGIPCIYPDLADVKGQAQAKRGLEIAAAGGHSVLMIGPPGTGKSMLAARFPGLLPPLSDDEALETAALASLGSGGFRTENWKQRPFRAPHHSASGVALVGGGSDPRPGEISLAHNGVLFLDELPEFERRVLEALREPLESGRVAISRAARQSEFPARFQLIAAMNPCACGFLGHPRKRCRCTPDQVSRYRGKISGPLLDRIDLHFEVPSLGEEDLTQALAGESSARVRERVALARERQNARQGKLNRDLTVKQVEQFCGLDEPSRRLLRQAMERLHLSARAYHRVRKIARTIADLAGNDGIASAQIAEAIQYRRELDPVN